MSAAFAASTRPARPRGDARLREAPRSTRSSFRKAAAARAACASSRTRSSSSWWFSPVVDPLTFALSARRFARHKDLGDRGRRVRHGTGSILRRSRTDTFARRTGRLPRNDTTPSSTKEPTPCADASTRPSCSRQRSPCSPCRSRAARRPTSSSARCTPAAETPARRTPTTSSSCSTEAPRRSTSPAGRCSTRRLPARAGR